MLHVYCCKSLQRTGNRLVLVKWLVNLVPSYPTR
jgi:hypothetical protein